ncbi:short-chain dehydrogenase/reductase [Aurantivibrio plasticivorans]
MDLRLAGKTALITGASQGIGRAIAIQLAAEGCHLRLAARDRGALDALAIELKKKFAVCVDVFAIDLSVGDNARALVEKNNDIDFLVNNAGAIPRGSIDEIDEQTLREAWDLKVFGYINCMQAMLRHMRQRNEDKAGVIINIIGAGGERPTQHYIAGAGGNAALMAMTRALGADSLRYGVRVVGINPGLIRTARLETQLKRAANKKWQQPERWEELIDAKRPPAEPSVIADMTAFLLSERSSYTTGTIVTIDGGSSARPQAS